MLRYDSGNSKVPKAKAKDVEVRKIERKKKGRENQFSSLSPSACLPKGPKLDTHLLLKLWLSQCKYFALELKTEDAGAAHVFIHHDGWGDRLRFHSLKFLLFLFGNG